MHMNTRYFCILMAVLLLAALLVLPVSAATDGKPTISASLSAVYLKTGQPLTVMGVATGTVTEGVQIWVFAGNYVNVGHGSGQILPERLQRPTPRAVFPPQNTM